MLRSTNGKMLVALLVVALIVIAAAVAVSKTGTEVAQAPPGAGGYGVPPPGQGGMGPGPGGMGPGGPGQGGMGPGMRGGMMGGGMMMPQSPAVTAAGEYVYVVQGNMLYQYNAKTLKLANKAELPRPTPPTGGGGQAPPPPQGGM